MNLAKAPNHSKTVPEIGPKLPKSGALVRTYFTVQFWLALPDLASSIAFVVRELQRLVSMLLLLLLLRRSILR